MNIKSLILKLTLTICGFVFLFGINSTKIYAAGKPATPAGFDHVLLYMGTGIYDPNDPEPRPGLTDCSGLFCDGMYFQKEVMHRTDEEISELEVEAKEFYKVRFGIDVDDPTFSGRVGLEMFTVNPDFEYRVQLGSGMKVSQDGWMIRDGGFRLDVLDPNGIALGGESEGGFAPAGSAMFFGNYNILATTKKGKPLKEIIIFYRSKFPAFSLENGSFIFVCDMFHEEWGEGLGMGNIRFIPQEDGLIRGNGRNVLSFPPSSDVEFFPEFPPINANVKPNWWYYYNGIDNNNN